MAKRRIRVAVNGYGVIGKRVADAVAAQDDMELMSDLGRTRGDMWEVGLWEDSLTVDGYELFYNYQVCNQAIVIPENIDAIRALTGTEKDAATSILKTDCALGLRKDFTERTAYA